MGCSGTFMGSHRSLLFCHVLCLLQSLFLLHF